MNERDWQRLERQLIDAHVAADAPLSSAIWRGVEGALAARPARRGVRLAMGVVVALAAAGVALWLLPAEPVGPEVAGPGVQRASAAAEMLPGPSTESAASSASQPASAAPSVSSSASQPASASSASSTSSASSASSSASQPASAAPSVSSTSSSAAQGAAAASSADASRESASPPVAAERAAVTLNQVVETTRAVTFAMTADAGRIEVEPCLGRFVNVTVLDSPHRVLRLAVQGRRVEARFDEGAVLAAGVAHVLVPADTHLIISTRSGRVVVRGLGGPMEIDTQSGEVRVDTAPRLDPTVTIASDSGAIAWQGRCAGGCRVEARSRTGDVTLRAPDRSPFTRGVVRGESDAGSVHFEELSCTDPRCSSSPLPWRQPAAGNGH